MNVKVIKLHPTPPHPTVNSMTAHIYRRSQAMSTLAMPPKEPIPYRVWKKVDQDPDLLQLVDADML